MAAAVEFDADDRLLVGRIAGINDVVGFHGSDAERILAAFREAVDDYIETCAAIGKAPEKAYSDKLMIRTDPSVHAKAALAATLEGVSLNQFAERALRECADETVRRKAPPVPDAPADSFDRLLIARSVLDRLTLVSSERLFDRFGVERLW